MGLSCRLFVTAILSALLPLTRCRAQPYWSATGLSLWTGPVNAVHCGASGALYYGGYFDLDPDEPLAQQAVLRYAEGDWDTLWSDCSVVSLLEFHDTLFAAGSCGPVNPADTPAVANVKYWDNGTWVQYGVFDTWYALRLRAIDDTLYCTGSFSVADGQPCKGVARRIGGQWQPLPLLPSDIPIISDIIKFEGDLVVCGTGIYVGNTSRIARLHAGEWVPMGPGIVGGQSILRVMREYEGDLYIAGNIYMGEGNPGRDILRWRNGTFETVGDPGLQHYAGNNGGTSTVFDMVVHDSLLFVGGGFRFAGGAVAQGMATWNGEHWCGVPGNLSDGPGHIGCFAMDFYHDTLFVGCGLMADDDTVASVAKYIGDPFSGPCGYTGIAETPEKRTIGLYPNPASNTLWLVPPMDAAGMMEVVDMTGRITFTAPAMSRSIDVSGWGSGIYLLRSNSFASVQFMVE